MRVPTWRIDRCVSLAAAALCCLAFGTVSGQVLFDDDFEDGEIDTAKWRLDSRPFETGAGDFEALETDGQLVLGGTATKNWWGGLALATVPTFTASSDAPLTFEVERVMHDRADNVATGAGENSSTRTSVWIADASRENYVLFSHNSNEGGWTYNKRVGDPDDNATNAGINIFEFDEFDTDFGSHVMSMTANGETVQLFLDDIPGPEVRFPFSEGIVFEIAVYARRGEGSQPTDQVKGVFDDVVISGSSEPCVTLAPDFTQVPPGGDDPELTLQLPGGVPRPATVTITSSAPGVAAPSGATNGVLEVVFAEGDPRFRSIPVAIAGEGLAVLAVTTDFDACTSDPARVYVPAVLLEDDFEDGEIDESVWTVSDNPFEDGSGSFDAVEDGGVVRLAGEGEEAFWPGIALLTKDTFPATVDQPVTFQVDQTLSATSVGLFRAGVWVTDPSGEDFVFFSFVRGGGGDWGANSTTTDLWPPTGEGTDLAAYNCCGFDALDVARRVEIAANGETAAVIMDGVKGGEAPFPFSEVIFGFGAYAGGAFDTVDAAFDNARILGPGSGESPVTFARGDANADGSINLTDGVTILGFLFLGNDPPPCMDAADANDDAALQLTDAVAIFNWLFLGGPPPQPPEPDGTSYSAASCGPDPTDDGFDCAAPPPVCAGG